MLGIPDSTIEKCGISNISVGGELPSTSESIAIKVGAKNISYNLFTFLHKYVEVLVGINHDEALYIKHLSVIEDTVVE